MSVAKFVGIGGNVGSVGAFTGLPFVGVDASMQALGLGAADVYETDVAPASFNLVAPQLTDSGFYITQKSEEDISAVNPWQSRANNGEHKAKFSFQTAVLPESKFNLVFTKDILPFVDKVFATKLGEPKEAAHEYLQLLSALVKGDESFAAIFPSREAYLFAVAESLARVDQFLQQIKSHHSSAVP